MTILVEKAFVLSNFANAIYSATPMLRDPYEIVIEDTPRHPLYYPIPLNRAALSQYDAQTMTIDLYLKLTREDQNTGLDHIYIPLHRGILVGDQTTRSIVSRSDIQLLICNDTYLDFVQTHNMDRSGRHLLGTVNIRHSAALTTNFPHKVDFGNVASRTDQEVTRNDLELPIGKLWEIAVTNVTCISPEDNKTVLIPTPLVAKSICSYDLYAGEIMIGPAMMFPYYLLDRTSATEPSMSDVFKQLWDQLPNSSLETYVNDNFGVMYYMFREIESRYPKTSTLSTVLDRQFYATDYDLMSTYLSTETIKRSPLLWWNYLDTLYRDNTSAYTMYGGDYALFSIDDLVKHKPLTTA